jgi:hypothetical protein
MNNIPQTFPDAGQAGREQPVTITDISVTEGTSNKLLTKSRQYRSHKAKQREEGKREK